MPMRAKGGRVNAGSKVYEEGRRNGTQVQHDAGKNDISPKNLNRPRVVTFNTGGGVKSFKVGGRVESPDGVAKASKLPGGAGGGEARLTKAHRQARKG
jgi:collagenase-like PrtC family protease